MGNARTMALLVTTLARECTTRELMPTKSAITLRLTEVVYITARQLENLDSACLIGLPEHIKCVYTLLLMGSVCTSVLHATNQHDMF